MLVFNHSGLLVPDTLIPSTFEELKEEFVQKNLTEKRQRIFNNYEKYNINFKNSCNLNELHQWVNGSFVSKKTNPGDIDLVTFLNFQIVEELGEKIKDFLYPNSEVLYNVDAYLVIVYPENHPNRYVYLADRAYWMQRFTKTRRIRGNKLSKGFLEIFI